MRRIGIVGCGHIGTVHSYALRRLTQANLITAMVTATFDTDFARAAEMAKHHDAQPYHDLDLLLDNVDVVWICTWTSGHLEAVARAAERGLAVFCEKPLAATIEDCRRVHEVLATVPHQVGLVLRYAPVFAQCAEIVRSQEFGRVLTTIFRDDQYFPVQGMYGSTWRADRELAGGGTLIEHSIHDIDLLAWILGAPDSVSAATAQRFGCEGIEDTAVLHLGYPDTSRAVMISIWHQILSRGSTRRLEIFCEHALLWTEDDYLGPLHIQTSDGFLERCGSVPDWANQLDLPEVYEKSVVQYATPAKAFLDALDGSGGRSNGFPTSAEALASHLLVEAAYQSAAVGGVPISVVAL